MMVAPYETTCEGKRRFTLMKARHLSEHFYLCPYCGWYHGTSVSPTPWQRNRPELRAYSKNLEKITAVYNSYVNNGALFLNLRFQNNRYELVATRSY